MTRSSRVEGIQHFDFTGGLNTRKSSFQLLPNEVPEILNMEIDPRGGVYTRKGWDQWSTDEVVTPGVDPYILADGTGKHVTVPDEAGFDLTGDCQIVVGLRLSDWTPSAPKVIACHTSATGGFGEPTADGWVLILQTNGRLLFINRHSGGTRSYTSSAAVPASINTNWWVGISYDVNNGAGSSQCRFWQSNVGPNGAWTEVGTGQTVANTNASIAGNAVLRLGAGVGGNSPVAGRLLHLELRNAIGASNTMSTVNVVHELDTSTDLASSSFNDLTFTTASADTATLTGTGMLVNSSAWNPRNAYLHENTSGTQYVLVANGTTLWSASGGGVFTSITNSDLAASPHLASFAPWGDNVYVAQGRTKQGMRTTGTGTGTLLTASGAGQWQNDPNVHTGTHMMKAEHVTAHNGRLFVANVNYDSTNYPNRIHWSHVGFPESWDQDDFIEINTGGSKITGLAAFTDHLLIFKTDSIWALFGSDATTWQLAKITGDLGVPHPTAIAIGIEAAYFFAGDGIYRYRKGSLEEVSYPLRNIFPDIPVSAYNNIWLGWMDRRLWASVPYSPETPELPPTDAVGLFVFDPLVGENGAWTRFRGAVNHAIGPYVDHTSSADAPTLAFCRFVPQAIKLNAHDEAEDNLRGELMGFDSYVRTGWFDAGNPSLKKAWRRPEYFFRNLSGVFTLKVESFIDYNPETTRKSNDLDIDAVGEPGLWGDGGLWGEGTWAASEAGLESQILKGRNHGLARALALRLSAPEGSRWGLNNITTKFVPRKFR